MDKILVIVFVLIAFDTTAKSRRINMAKELKSALFVGEVIFNGYDSVEISKYSDSYQRVLIDSLTGKEYGDTNYTQMVWNISQVYFNDFHNNKMVTAGIQSDDSWGYYISRPDTFFTKSLASHGFWPRIGDTCIVVIDSNNNVSILALLESNQYIFWDPYLNSSWMTSFGYEKPFKAYPKEPTSKFFLSVCESVKNWFDCTYCAPFHISIGRNEFWEEVMERQP